MISFVKSLNLFLFYIGFAVLVTFQTLIPNSYAHPCAACKSLGATSRCAGCKAEHYCNSACQRAAWKTHSASCKLRDGVKIGPSKIPAAGNGLFANRDFAQGDVVAVYFGDVYSETDLVKRLQFEGSSYLQTVSTSLINGSVDPPVPHLGAQLANDPYIDRSDIELLLGVDCSHLTPEYLSAVTELSRRYWLSMAAPEATQMKNVEIGTKMDEAVRIDGKFFPYLKASRSIRADEEIFYSYGPSFWTSIPQHICFRKGLPEASLEIQRAAAVSLEKMGALGELAQAIDTSYISSGTYEEQKKFLMGPHRFLIQLKNLFVSSGQVGLMFKPSGDHPEQEWIDEMKVALRIDEKITEIAQAPNSDFYDRFSYGKVHPKGKRLLREMLEYMSAKRIQSKGWFADAVSRETISWDTFKNAFLE